MADFVPTDPAYLSLVQQANDLNAARDAKYSEAVANAYQQDSIRNASLMRAAAAQEKAANVQEAVFSNASNRRDDLLRLVMMVMQQRMTSTNSVSASNIVNQAMAILAEVDKRLL